MAALRRLFALTLLVTALGMAAVILVGPQVLGFQRTGVPAGRVWFRQASDRGRAAQQVTRATHTETLPVQGPPIPPPVTKPAPAQPTPVARPAPAPTAPVAKPVPPPAPERRTHRVKQGETLWELAREFHVSLEALATTNRGVDPGHLQLDQELVIPTEVKGDAAGDTVPVAAKLGRDFAWPSLGPISSLFGPRPKMGDFHSGIDVAVGAGTPVRAAKDGTVTLAGLLGGYGEAIIVDHGDGSKTLYAHLSRLLVEHGQKVARGDVIGLVGSTGRSTGPHLHFEVIVGGLPHNPLDFLPDVGLPVDEQR